MIEQVIERAIKWGIEQTIKRVNERKRPDKDMVGLKLVSPWSFKRYAKFNMSWSDNRPTESWASHGALNVPRSLQCPMESWASHRALSVPWSLGRPTESWASHGVLSIPQTLRVSHGVIYFPWRFECPTKIRASHGVLSITQAPKCCMKYRVSRRLKMLWNFANP